ncbi:phenylalanyl-tRNA synthetase subunit beta [Methylophaga lonarensis MPL]|uniref:Phenylalanine--tRNA ligase beta subunit n=1 Tax=Methylophaga lonarensis MPL TaxID=1286106 RepID=M7NT15_9GAMM|nr:phenylalanine--tRNA ligase subunit beta [Methylophaga lonarensis]EMR11913.1 phenylalanyl-tRNA synthetase subunit beta [Methylophaga lonarensis MPL]
MKFSEKWLREWVNPALDTDALVEKLTQAGLEVDSVTAVAGDFSQVKVGIVRSAVPHPDADKLRVCEVDVGDSELLNIVCGAANVRPELKVPVAVVGATLPGDFKIKKAKLRGVESFGMLCSAKELGLAESADGLLELPLDAPVGTDLRQYLQLDDVSIEVDLTPNRSDCLGVAGIAREVGVLTRTDLTPADTSPVVASHQQQFPVTVQATSACPRYIGRVITGINSAAETPLWMQEKLRRSGLRSLGPVVDVTNYVMLELGQPMHAFDLDKLDSNIEVRWARDNEQLLLLDGQTLQLNTDSLLIADAKGPLALAGVMGGQASSVQDTTTNLFLESAFFVPEAIAGKARSYGLHTDSSHRFERGVDPALPIQAMERATALLLTIVGGQAGPVIEKSSEVDLPAQREILLRAQRIKRVLGIEIDAATVIEQLSRLGMQVTETDAGWRVCVPEFRFDLSIEVDLIEELGRLYGYDKLPQTRPSGKVMTTEISESRLLTERLQQLLVDRGYHEAITYSFVDPAIQKQLLGDEVEAIALANPISADLSVMRLSLWPGLMQALTYNLNRQQDRVRLFELGRVFNGSLPDVDQPLFIAGLISGQRFPEQWASQDQKLDFFDIKADVEAILAMGGGDITFVAEQHAALHPGQSARVYKNDQAIGWLGALHPRLNKSFGVQTKVYLFELSLEQTLLAQVPSFKPLSRFPSIRRDLAIVVDNQINAGEIQDCLKLIDSDILKSIQVFDVYTGDGVELGKKSIALAFHIQHGERTLTDEEVDTLMQQVTETLERSVAAVVRS